MAVFEHQESYLLSMLAFIGLTDATVVRVEGSNLGADVKAAELAKAELQVAGLAV